MLFAAVPRRRPRHRARRHRMSTTRASVSGPCGRASGCPTSPISPSSRPRHSVSPVMCGWCLRHTWRPAPPPTRDRRRRGWRPPCRQ
jgi:hypothetical protein